MQTAQRVRTILSHYKRDRPEKRANVVRLLMHGQSGGTGRLLVLPVHQGFEHGPTRSSAPNPPAYDPHYLFGLAVDGRVSALAAPLEAGSDSFAGSVPMILKANNANGLAREQDQSVAAPFRDALQPDCSAIGYTIYLGADAQYGQIEEVREATAEAREHGLAVVIWAYPRGGELSEDGRTALDVVSYAAHMAALMGAHAIKTKVPGVHPKRGDANDSFEGVETDSLPGRVAHVMRCAFEGRRIVVFSGGGAKEEGDTLDEVRAIRRGGGSGSIIGRNTFQRPRDDALAMLERIAAIHSDGET
ncbi:class I fructose-bisphosphate aldolase [Citreimonas salinaria]|uniref:fructose-bisphosphate aldolase n=1 Tax=Citreimonas salinaria TaxID=321339 RepID=A0A1H3KAE4_9RHOB|nr:class I fructose-bisphosphate aldolase [Citreimonas salinaria]SDY48755.1 fructose-bisphosphate aldolase, class I [Citreimonas salinaria]